VEEIGHYDHTKQPAQVTIDTARADYWVGRGARMSPTVQKLVQQTKKKSA
jgi:ribosomal protein S16